MNSCDQVTRSRKEKREKEKRKETTTGYTKEEIKWNRVRELRIYEPPGKAREELHAE